LRGRSAARAEEGQRSVTIIAITNCYVNAIGKWKSTLHGREEAHGGL
jgi:hypothetical protein